MNNELIEKIPSPCYVLEEELLRRNLSLIQSVAKSANVEVILAFKAFALWKTFPIFREYIKSTTASSLYEAKLAFEEFGAKAHTFSPAYIESEFNDILRCSSHITFNSLSQFYRFYKSTLPGDQIVSCGLRINPQYSEIETELYNPCAPGSRFGVLSDDLLVDLPSGIDGFHCHTHCESDSFALERTLKQIELRFSEWLPKLKWLNLGGGHLMTRKDYDTNHLIEVLNSLHSRYPNLQIILEPGSAFAWQTGTLVSTVVDIVENSSVKTAIIDVSFTCHMPDCLEMPYQPKVRNAETLEPDRAKNCDKDDSIYRLGGNSCLSGDYMGSWKFDKPLEIGDKIIFEDMIHYTTVKTTMFNGITHPSIALLRLDGELDILRTFSYQDYRNRMC